VPPAPAARVNDYAGLLAPSDRERLEMLLADHERRTGAQMVIAIFRSLEGASLEDFSIRLAQQWRIGQKGLDNGVILLTFVDDRKVRLEVGYGLEPAISDAVAGWIIREVLAPRFRAGQYAAGLTEAIDAVFARVGGSEPSARPPSQPRAQRIQSRDALWSFLALGLASAIIVTAFVGIFRGGRRNAYTAGRRGWSSPSSSGPWWWGGGFGGGGWGGGSGGGFSGGGGGFGGGGASGGW